MDFVYLIDFPCTLDIDMIKAKVEKLSLTNIFKDKLI